MPFPCGRSGARALCCGLLLAALAAGLAPPRAHGDAPRVAVLYPAVGEPYRRVFEQIVDGIDHGLDAAAATRAVQETATAESVSAWIDSTGADLVIALGQGALRLARRSAGARPIVAGAAAFAPDDVDGVDALSLTPAPRLVFDRLREIAPRVDSVYVLYQPGKDDWIIERARAAAAATGIKLDTRAAQGLQAAARAYRDILDAHGATDRALWLLRNDALVDDQTLLPLILEQSWNRDRVVISNNPSHVKRGVLFALYPDHGAMGTHLARMAENRLAHPDRPHRLLPLESVRIAVNVRTAAHLGLPIDGPTRRNFDVVFPSP